MNELYHYGVGHLGGGKSGRYPWMSGKKWNDPKTIARNKYWAAKEKEPELTKAVQNAIQAAGGRPYGLENRLKTPKSIERKIKTDAIEKEISYDEASKMKDTVRYTMISDEDKYTEAYETFKKSMKDAGYSEERCKNYFTMYKEGLVKHKSVQSVFKDKDGFQFEVQFHTPASQNAKDKKVPIYEERRKPGLSKERQEELERAMVALAEDVPYPRGFEKIKSH